MQFTQVSVLGRKPEGKGWRVGMEGQIKDVQHKISGMELSLKARIKTVVCQIGGL